MSLAQQCPVGSCAFCEHALYEGWPIVRLIDGRLMHVACAVHLGRTDPEPVDLERAA